MTFQFIAHSDFNFLTSFAKKFKVPLSGDRLIIPASMGKGSVKKIDIGHDFKLLIHRYQFKEEFVLKRVAPKEWHDNVAIIFYSTTLPNNLLSNNERDQFQCKRNQNSSIEISSSDLNSEIRFPANMEIYFTVVGIKSSTLLELLGVQKQTPLLDSIKADHSTFLFYENMTQDVEKILEQLAEISDQNVLSHFYYKIKTQELLYLLFSKLLKRENGPFASMHKADIEKLFSIRTAILADMATPPQLNALAKMAGMSETKMKQSFKQVFGDSIYNYYQKARMSEAAFLLKQASYTVSEVGYQLGFSNLSHFSRLFQKHYGMNPKKYAVAG